MIHVMGIRNAKKVQKLLGLVPFSRLETYQPGATWSNLEQPASFVEDHHGIMALLLESEPPPSFANADAIPRSPHGSPKGRMRGQVQAARAQLQEATCVASVIIIDSDDHMANSNHQ